MSNSVDVALRETLINECLIKKFADAANKKAGEFYTPRSVVRMMIDMLDPKEDETIYDPACGTGGMLLAAVQHVKDKHGDTKRLWGKLFGQEKNLTTSAIRTSCQSPGTAKGGRSIYRNRHPSNHAHALLDKHRRQAGIARS